jgi:demethylmenaquinone methyltransferase/2-methoxy-6-polyprenyl-1,4-benzoquinol methylase
MPVWALIADRRRTRRVDLSGLGLGANVVAVQLPDPETLLQEQIAYYRARAPEYDSWWLRTGRYESDDQFGRRWEAGKRELEDALRVFSPAGDVLEIAAGTGNLTAALVAVDGVERITAVDASDEALAIARTKVADTSRVSFLQADVFDWQPRGQFDVVAFGFWLSHVPPRRFESFWQLVAEALRPGGRVFFTDNAIPVELAASATGRQALTSWSRTLLDRGVSLRTLADGRQFHIVKRAWSPGELEQQLATLGWSSTVREHQGLFIHGGAARQNASQQCAIISPRLNASDHPRS